MTWALFFKIVAVWWFVRTIVSSTQTFVECIKEVKDEERKKTPGYKSGLAKVWRETHTKYVLWFYFPDSDVNGYSVYSVSTEKPLSQFDLDYISKIPADKDRAKSIMLFLNEVEELNPIVKAHGDVNLDKEEE